MKQPILRHVSSPVPAGSLAVATGDNFSGDDVRILLTPAASCEKGEPSGMLPAENAQTVEATITACGDGHTLTFLVPEGEFGVWSVAVETQAGKSKPILLNQPEIKWISRETVARGEEFRIFGTGLTDISRYPEGEVDKPVSYGGYLDPGDVSVLVRDSAGHFSEAQVIKVSAYDVHVRMPDVVAEGPCQVYIHNGRGGCYGWSKPADTVVCREERWPEDVFNVLDFGARSMELRDVYYNGLFDSAPAFQKALDAAAANGGGIVYVPNGRYCFKGSLKIPRKTILRGEDKDRVWLELPKGVSGEDGWGTPEEGMKILTFITGEGDFKLENLNIHAVYTPVIIAAPVFDGPPKIGTDKFNRIPCFGNLVDGSRDADHISIINCNIVHEPSFFSQRKDTTDPVFKDEFWGGQHGESKLHVWAAIAIKGRHITIENNQIKGAGTPMILMGAQYSRIANNRLFSGSYSSNITMFSSSYNPDQHWFRENKYIIIEDNDLHIATNLNRSLFWIMESHSHYYAARNYAHPLFWPSDAEGLCFHHWGDYWVLNTKGGGRSLQLDRASMKALYDDVPDSHRFVAEDGTLLPGIADGRICYTIGGTGIGQWKAIVSSTEDTLTFDSDWDTELDETTVVCISTYPKFHNMLVIDNVVNESGRGAYFWGSAYETVMDGNRMNCNSGVLMEDLSRHYKMDSNWQFCGHYYNQILHNSLTKSRGFCSNYGVIGVSGGGLANSTVSMLIRGNVCEDDGVLTACPRYNVAEGLNYLGVAMESNFSRDCKIGIETSETVDLTLKDNRFENVELPIVGVGEHTKEV